MTFHRRSKVQPGRVVALLALLAPGSSVPMPAQGPAPAERDLRTAAPVELRCKLTVPRGQRGYKLWRVELKRSSGEPFRQQVAGGGDTVRFKDLAAAIYVLCVSGEMGKGRCESVDLTPSHGSPGQTFHKKMDIPSSSAHDNAHQVDATKLAVPEKARRELIRSEAAQLRGDKRAAVEHLERAVQIHPTYTDALNNLGTHHHRAGDYERSIQYFTKVVDIDGRFFPGWINLGGSLLALGRLEPALEANLRAIRLRPNDPLVNSQLGANYFYLRRYADAKACFQRVVALDPMSANSPQLFLAHIAMAERSPEDAARHIRSYLDLHPNSPKAPGLRKTLESLATPSAEAGRDTPTPER